MSQKTSTTTARAANVGVQGAVVALVLSFFTDQLTPDQAMYSSVIGMAGLGILAKVLRNATAGTAWEGVLS